MPISRSTARSTSAASVQSARITREQQIATDQRDEAACVPVE
jgi:hypothetical protein